MLRIDFEDRFTNLQPGLRTESIRPPTTVMKAKSITALSLMLVLTCERQAWAHADLLAFIARLTAQINTNQNDADALIQRADLYRLHGNWDEARADHAAAGRIAPGSTSLLLGQAQLQVDLGEDSSARTAYDAVLSRDPTNAAALFGRAPVLARLGERKAAIADYSRGLALSAFPQPGHFLERAGLQAAEYGADEAIKGLEEGLARLGWMVALQKAAIELELQRQQTDEALARLETIITRSNRKETWLAWKGEILLTAGRTQQAQDVLSAALKAIDGLPPRMRTSPGMTELRAKVEGLLGSPTAGSGLDKKQAGESKLADKKVD